MTKTIYYLSDPPYDMFLVGNYIPPVHLELLKLYCKN